MQSGPVGPDAGQTVDNQQNDGRGNRGALPGFECEELRQKHNIAQIASESLQPRRKNVVIFAKTIRGFRHSRAFLLSPLTAQAWDAASAVWLDVVRVALPSQFLA
jgi:hypothetical protein